MIQLTQEQVQALAIPGAANARVMNPQTNEMFVLVPLAEFERLSERSDVNETDWNDEERDQMREEACQLLDSLGSDK